MELGITIEQAARLIAHPLRVELLRRYADPPPPHGWSPSDLAAEIGESIGNVSYHTRKLAAANAILLVTTKQVRGAIEHFYSAGSEGQRVLALADAWERA